MPFQPILIHGAIQAETTTKIYGTHLNRQRSRDIRAWAKERGLAVSERGRIPASVLKQYHAASGR